MRGLVVGGTSNIFKSVSEKPFKGALYQDFTVSEESGEPASFETTLLGKDIVMVTARQGNTCISMAATKELLEEALSAFS